MRRRRISSSLRSADPAVGAARVDSLHRSIDQQEVKTSPTKPAAPEPPLPVPVRLRRIRR